MARRDVRVSDNWDNCTLLKCSAEHWKMKRENYGHNSWLKVQAGTVFSNKKPSSHFPERLVKAFHLSNQHKWLHLDVLWHMRHWWLWFYRFFSCNFPPRARVVMEHLEVPALLIVRDSDYLSSWWHLLSTSWVFPAAAGCLLETKRFSAGETPQPSMFFWTIRHNNWQIRLCGRKRIFKFPPWLSRFNTVENTLQNTNGTRGLGSCFMLNNSFVSGGAHALKNPSWPHRKSQE